MKIIIGILGLIFFSIFIYSCDDFQFVAEGIECNTEYNYDEHVRTILNSKCSGNNTSCHVPSGQFPNYEDWDAMQSTLSQEGEDPTQSKFYDRVVTKSDMPPSWAAEFALDTAEFKILRCWSEAGFPKN